MVDCDSSSGQSEITPPEFAFLARRAGLRLTEAQTTEFRDAYILLQAMVALMQRPRDRSTEPAHVFTFDRDSDR